MKFLNITLFVLLSLFFSTLAIAQVKAYGQSDFSGTSITLKPGKYMYTQLQKRGLSTLEGLRIPKGCRVKMYDSENLEGASKSFGKNNPQINNQTPYSLRVTCGSVGSKPGFAIGASDETGRRGDLIFVDVNITDFNKIVSMQYSMNWDPSILRFEKIQNFNLKDLSKENFGLKEVQNGNLLMAWYDQSVQGVNLANGTNIYQVVFRVIGENTEKSKIRFSGKPLIAEIMLADGTPVYFNKMDGSFVAQK